ncbi:MAG: glycoside hydrolase family 18 protein [Caldilineaceae bacterium]
MTASTSIGNIPPPRQMLGMSIARKIRRTTPCYLPNFVANWTRSIQLAAHRRHPCRPSTYGHYELDKIHPYLNWINLMSYDLHGTWESTTNFHAHLHPADGDSSKLSVQEAVEGYLAAGVPANKLVMGIPFYGIGWAGVPNQNNGLYQSAAGPAPSTGGPGSETYRLLKTLAYPSFRDPVTGGFWIYNGDVFWSYDDPQVIAAKVVWLKERGLAGAMVWSIDQDDVEGTLLNAVSEGLASGSIFLPVITKAETGG